MDSNFRAIVAAKTWTLLRYERAVLTPSGIVFWVKPAKGRLMLVFDPAQVVQDKINEKFAHKLSTLLQGRRVVRSNHRGLCLQVGLDIPPVIELASTPLDLSKQPTPWSLPLGPTADGSDLWLSLVDDDSFLVGGARDMGKSHLLHGFIQALLNGGQTEIYAWDGKDNVEYLRYYGLPHFHLIPFNRLEDGLDEVRRAVVERMRSLTVSGQPNINLYNAAHPDQIIPPIALFIDEATEAEDQDTLVKLVKVYRAAGVHPVLATNDPTKAGVVCKSNLTTRIAMRVLSYNDSLTILTRTGAEKLPQIAGRGLVVRKGELVQFQGFEVSYPQPSQEALDWAAQQAAEMVLDAGAGEGANDTRVRQLIDEGVSDTQIVRTIWGVSGGSRFYDLIEKVKTIRATTTTSEVPSDGGKNA